MESRSNTLWTFAITSVALFMVTLDNLVVTSALPVIRHNLHASLTQLEWTVNAYTLTFAVLLLTGAALGDRYGRRLMFSIGIGVFTLGSAVAAMSTTATGLDLARALQGVGGAIVTPLTLTLLSAAVPREKRGLALGAWGGIGGLAVAIGPLVGGAIVEGLSWEWIFWVNVPIGLVLAPLAFFRLRESHGPADRLDLAGLGLASAGLLGIVWGLVRGNSVGWSSPEIVGSLVAGAIVLVLFVLWELRAPAPMLPMRFFRNRTFALTNVSSLFMFFGMFGSIFLLIQFFQTVQGYSPLQAGLRILPWTAMPIFIAPIAGAWSDRIGGQRLMAAGLALQAVGLAWIATVSSPTMPYSDDAVLRRRRAVLPFWNRHGALLRAGRERRAELRTPCRGRPGFRRQQRDPRARWRLRRRSAGLDLRSLRRLRRPAALRRRFAACCLGRRRARRRRRVGRTGNPWPAARGRSTGACVRGCKLVTHGHRPVRS